METETKAIELDIKMWAVFLALNLETDNKKAAVFAIKEIEDIISRVCYVYNLFEEMPVPKR